MGCLEGSGVPVLYIGRTVPKVNKKDSNAMFTKCEASSNSNRAAVLQFFFTAKSGAGLSQRLQAQF